MTVQPTPGSAGFARLYWMFLGPMILLLVAIGVVNGGGWFAPRSFVFLGLLALLLVCRWAEFHAGDAPTSDCEPATADQLRRYVLIATLIGLGVWIATILVGVYWNGV
jgi:hypothetical protein